MRIERTHVGDMSDRLAFLVPVVIDDTSDSREHGCAGPLSTGAVDAPACGGEATPGSFVERIARLLSPGAVMGR